MYCDYKRGRFQLAGRDIGSEENFVVLTPDLRELSKMKRYVGISKDRKKRFEKSPMITPDYNPSSFHPFKQYDKTPELERIIASFDDEDEDVEEGGREINEAEYESDEMSSGEVDQEEENEEEEGERENSTSESDDDDDEVIGNDVEDNNSIGEADEADNLITNNNNKKVYAQSVTTQWECLSFDKPESVDLNFIDCSPTLLDKYNISITHIQLQYEKDDNFFIVSGGRVFYVKQEYSDDGSTNLYVYHVNYSNGEELRDVLSLSSHFHQEAVGLVMSMTNSDCVFGHLVKEGIGRKERRYCVDIQRVVPFSSGFDMFRSIVYKERTLLFAIESARGNCELYDLDELFKKGSLQLIWNARIEFGERICDFTLKNLYSNIVGLFLVRVDDPEEYENVEYALSVRTINLTKGRLGKMVRVVDDIPFYDERFKEEFTEQRKNVHRRNMFPYPSRFRTLRFSSAVAFNSNEIRIIFYDNRLKELYEGDLNRPMYFKMNLTNLKQRSKIYSILHFDRTTHTKESQYRKIQEMLSSSLPKMVTNGKCGFKKDKKNLFEYYRQKRKMLNDTYFKNHILKTFTEDLSTAVYEKNDRDFYQVSETIIDAYYDLFQLGPLGCCYYSSHEYRWNEAIEFNPIFFYFNMFLCGYLFFFINLYVNCFCWVSPKEKNLSFFRKQQNSVRQELEKQKKFCMDDGRVHEYEKLLNKIVGMPNSVLLRMTCCCLPIYTCFNQVVGCGCYVPRCIHVTKELLNKYCFSIVVSLSISISGSLLVFVLANFLLTKVFFTCMGSPWGATPVCSRRGYCSNPNIFGFGKCICNRGYHKDDCHATWCYQIDSDEMDSVCSGHGACVDINECDCDLHYSGKDCRYFDSPSRKNILEEILQVQQQESIQQQQQQQQQQPQEEEKEEEEETNWIFEGDPRNFFEVGDRKNDEEEEILG